MLADAKRRTPRRWANRSSTKPATRLKAEQKRGVGRDRVGHGRRAEGSLAGTRVRTLAVELAGKIVDARLDPADHARLIERGRGPIHPIRLARQQLTAPRED